MPDIPVEAVRAAAEAIERELMSGRDCSMAADSDEALARAALEAAAPVLADGLRDHIDTDHGIMVQLGIIADTAVKMLEHVNMDTDEDRELHARAVGALRGRLGEIAAAIQRGDYVACDIPEVPREP